MFVDWCSVVATISTVAAIATVAANTAVALVIVTVGAAVGVATVATVANHATSATVAGTVASVRADWVATEDSVLEVVVKEGASLGCGLGLGRSVVDGLGSMVVDGPGSMVNWTWLNVDWLGNGDLTLDNTLDDARGRCWLTGRRGRRIVGALVDDNESGSLGHGTVLLVAVSASLNLNIEVNGTDANGTN